MFFSCISVPRVKQIVLGFYKPDILWLGHGCRWKERGGNGSTGSRGGQDGREKGREKEMIGQHMNNPQVLITFLHMCSFVFFCSAVSIASSLLQNPVPPQKMPSLLLWRSQNNDAATRPFNVADKLQHVNSVYANSTPPAAGTPRKDS